MLLSVTSARRSAFLIGSLLLAGCSALPTNGPTTRQILHAESADNPLGFKILDINPTLVRQINAQEEASVPAVGPFESLVRPGDVDEIGPGDILQISVFEVGVTLFGGTASFGAETFDPAARGRSLPGIAVDKDGAIRLPYIGRVIVAGKTPAQVEQLIEGALRGKSQNPQAVVTVSENVSNTVYVSGAVNRPGRFPLSAARERLLDALAVGGGAAGPADNMVVRFTRGGRSVETRLSGIRTGSPQDLVLLPGDRVELIQRPRTYSVFGATSRVALLPFETDQLTLAEAIARVGGPNDQLADPRGVFLFRYVAEQNGAPIIYRLNMMDPTNYFLAQNVRMHDKDIIYVSNSASNLPTKFISVLNQLFSPFLTARVLLDTNN